MTTWPFGRLRPLSYDVIVADPPWRFQHRGSTGLAKSAVSHYRLMSLAEIKALPVSQLAAGDCLFLLWVIAPMLPQGLAVLDAWGATYKSFLVWEKVTASGKIAMGTGYRVRSMAELVLVGTIGNPRHAPLPGVVRGVRTAHSRKPDEFYAAVERATPDLFRRADLFARERRRGWHGWGDEYRQARR